MVLGSELLQTSGLNLQVAKCERLCCGLRKDHTGGLSTVTQHTDMLLKREASLQVSQTSALLNAARQKCYILD